MAKRLAPYSWVFFVAGLLTIVVAAAPWARAAGPSWHRSDVTLYGWPDNDPPGGAIAYPRMHSTAGGTGTYANPVTMSSDSRELRPGTRIYVPYLHKYFVMEDDCAQCDSDWAHGWWHVDLWIGGRGWPVSAVYRQENKLTNVWQWIVVNPPANWWVSPRPLLDY